LRLSLGAYSHDTDCDGVPDDVEASDGTDPNEAASFKDSDGLPDYEPPQPESNEEGAGDGEPDATDTEGEPGATDTNGVSEATPLDYDPALTDTDGDGLSDADEALYGSDPNVADTDDDGLLDADEFAFGT
jgi:hypothetical protein